MEFFYDAKLFMQIRCISPRHYSISLDKLTVIAWIYIISIGRFCFTKLNADPWFFILPAGFQELALGNMIPNFLLPSLIRKT